MKVKNRSAFTLIELLVVVLIIGILSAIALPQYQKAVEKARIAEAVQMLHSIARACQIHDLEDEEHSCEFSNMDISFPGEITTFRNGYEVCDYDECFNTKNWQYVNDGGGDFYARRIVNEDLENPLYRLDIGTYDKEGTIYCRSSNFADKTFCPKLCGGEVCEVK